MLRVTVSAICTVILLSGCETPTTQRYAVSAENNIYIKALGFTGIGVSTFEGPTTFDANCRAAGTLQVADGMTHAQYIQRAFEDEFKLAGVFAGSGARRVLSGKVERLEFSSTRALTGGSWTIDLQLTSSNGASMKVREYYEFSSGIYAPEACRNTAEAFFRAVQNLVLNAVKASAMPTLLK